MVSKGLTGVGWTAVIPGAKRTESAPQSSPHTHPSYPAQAGYPVRRGLSALSLASLEYWIVRPGAQLRTRRTMTTNTPPHSRGAFRPGFANPFRPKKRAQGMPGACCTRGLVCNRCVRDAHTSIQVQPEHSGIPCAMVLRLMPRSPRRRIPLASVIGELTALRARSGSQHLRRLDASHGCQDHTVLPYASASFVCRAVDRSQAKARPAITLSAAGAAASTAFRPNVRDDRDTPLLAGRNGRRL